MISFYDEMICVIDERKSVDVIYVDFSEVFDTISQSILERLVAHALDRSIVRWDSSWCLLTSCIPRAQCWDQFCFVFLSMIRMRGLSVPSVHSQVTPC